MPYLDPTRTIDERVDDLLSRMTTAERLAQLGSVWVFQIVERGKLATESARRLMGEGMGQITRVSGASDMGSRDAARVANEIQRFLVEETRLGIPAIIHEEVCSGLMSKEATVFPQAIGVAATFDPGLVEEMAAAVASEMKALGARQGLAPVLDVCRDPRWGRTEETYGEDPHLTAMLGVAFVRGLQGTDLSQGVIATAKHFVGYGASEGGLNWAPAHLPPRELREVYLHPFEAAVRTADLRSVMNAYHEIDGVPCAANAELFRLLREGWGFQGCVVTDYFAVRQLAEYHRLAADGAEAGVLALQAGLDVELPSTDCFGDPLLTALESGAVSTDVVDDAVRRVLRSKFELGLFERPFVDEAAAEAVVGAGDHVRVATELTRRSIVLLRNEGVLPLAPDLEVAVIGPNADEGRNLLGDYSYAAHVESLLEMSSKENVFAMPIPDELGLDGSTAAVPTVLHALRERLGSRVGYSRGCSVNDSSKQGFEEAVALARRSDVVVMVMGDKSGLTDECTSGESRDRLTLELPGVQEDLVKEVMATGTPVVLVLVAGRPSGSAEIHEGSAAVMMAWLPGQDGGDAIAGILTGEFTPSGKLPITYPRTAGQIPIYYGHKVSGGRSHWKGDYVDGPVAPLYPFGHGLGYTTFELTDPQVTATDTSVRVSVRVANTGDWHGEEVIQVYTRDPRASVTRPRMELKAFARVALAPEQAKGVGFGIPLGQLGYYDRKMRYVVEPGPIEVMIGTSSAEVIPAGEITIALGGEIDKAFGGSVDLT